MNDDEVKFPRVELSNVIDDDTEFIPLLTTEDEESMHAQKIPSQLSILPLRNTVLFPGVEMVYQYAHVSPEAVDALLTEASPIVLLQAKEEGFKQLNMEGIAPGLSSIGVMLPYAPLLEWIISAFKKPLIATSGNISGSCIVFQSKKIKELFQYADFVIDHNRDIVIPQDDSVIRFAENSRRQVILRRSRGLAPAIILSSGLKSAETIFAAGATLKSTLAVQHNNQIYLSQFLGNLESYDTQQSYQLTFSHFLQLLKAGSR